MCAWLWALMGCGRCRTKLDDEGGGRGYKEVIAKHGYGYQNLVTGTGKNGGVRECQTLLLFGTTHSLYPQSLGAFLLSPGTEK